METPFIIKSAEFEKSAVRPAHYPSDLLPEVAFAGRSNVGKSSLINCLVQRKKLVRTSRTPGQTQTINFFRINDAFFFVDLPGYGFAKVPESVRAGWGPMMEAYFAHRPSIRCVVQIMDARHVPTQDDLNLWKWLRERRIPAVPVLTKADKLNRRQSDSQLRQVCLILGVPCDEVILFSSVTKAGRQILLDRLLGCLGNAGDEDE